LRCLHSKRVAHEWVIDTTNETVDQTYSRHFARFVESRPACGDGLYESRSDL
jgi:hypothetical protein